MRIPLHGRKLALAGVACVALVTTATVAYGAVTEPKAVSLKSTWVNGGAVKLELENRNVEPMICFVWDNRSPQDGDAIASRILTLDGTEAVDLGGSDQWIDGAGEGCGIPVGDRFVDVFTHPDRYVVEFEVVENQGTPETGPVRSQPLQLDSA